MDKTYEKNTVLFVDDEDNILKSLKRGLMRESYKKIFAHSGAEALEIMETKAIDVIVTDMRMPGMTGLELLRIVKDKYPDTVKLVLSGYTQLPQVLATVNQVDIYKFITKPWDLENEFKQVIRDSIDYYNVKFENELLRKSVSKKNELYQKLLKSNDEKLMNIKQDFREIFRMQKDMQFYMNELCIKHSQGKLEDTEFIDVSKQVSELFGLMESHFPSEYCDIKVGDLIEDVNRIVFNLQHPDVKYEAGVSAKYVGFIGIENIKNSSYRGNYKLLLLVFKIVFKNIHKSSGGNIFNIIVKPGALQSVNGSSMSKVTFLINETMLMHEENKQIIEANEIFLNHLLKCIGGAIQLTEREGKLLTIIEVELQIMFEEVRASIDN